MAEWVTPVKTADHPTESIKIPVKMSLYGDERFDEAMTWLTNRARPGLFSITDRRHTAFGSSVTYNITDPDVAFEFKMRFG